MLNNPQICNGSIGLVTLGLLILEFSVLHTDILHSVRLLLKSDRPLAEIGTRQRIQHSQDTHMFGP